MGQNDALEQLQACQQQSLVDEQLIAELRERCRRLVAFNELMLRQQRKKDTEMIRRAVQAVLWNASNYPSPAQAYIVGQDITALTTRVVAAVAEALA